MTDNQKSELSPPPWLVPLQQSLLAGWAGGRFPHALLFVGVPGLGQSQLASWTAALALCDRALQAPCGTCPACELLRAGSHPDLHIASLEEDASQVKVDQVRGLAEVLGLKSYRGGYKVGIVDPADRMNVNAANALLKTLEEPTPGTLLVLVASRLERLPATIASRCQRVTVRRPPRAEALAWLHQAAGAGDWDRLLDLAAGAPLRAVELAALGMGEIDREMSAALAAEGPARFDPIAAAEAWSRDRPAERLTWLEYWLAGRIRTAAGEPVNNNRFPALPTPDSAVNIRASFDLLDRVREGRALLQGSLNVQLMFEGLLVKAAGLQRGRVGAAREGTW